MSGMKKHPVDLIEWRDVDALEANDWNPNHVFSKEYRLLELSILRSGWIQPILIDAAGTIIDGYHRATLARTSKAVRKLTGGKVPCVVMDIPEPERILLTVRINRAKGSHVAVKMHELVARLIDDHGLTREHVAESIGATKDEVELLLQDGVFAKLKIDEHQYSKAWVPA